MLKDVKDFENQVQYFGYTESGKAAGTRNFYKPGSELSVEYQKGWDIGKAELNS